MWLQKSTILIIFSSILIFLIIFPQQSSQQELISKSNTIEVHCILSYDPQGRYNCYLFNIHTNSSTDVLDIVGSHLPNLTDADVHGVIHVNSMINQFNGEVLRKFVNLKFLNLRSTFLNSINPNAFETCGQLEELEIGTNPQILELPSRMLANCENLKIFSALSSRFLTLPGDTFGNTRSLEIFDTSHGRLTSIPDGLFQNMTNLRTFKILNCQLTKLSPKTFENVAKLEEFDVSGNQLSDPQEVMDLLSGHLGLKKIAISYNNFTMFNLSFFTQFDNLEKLTFGGNQNMTNINWNVLPNSLQILKVYQIGEEVPENAFENLSNLKHLYISGYGITILQKGTFDLLTKLDRLEITSTRLSTLHPQLFANQINLSKLDLSFNEIEELPDGIFAPFINLGINEGVEGLFMVLNKLESLSVSAFGQHPHLRYIDFSYNQIDKIQRGMFSRFNPVPVIASFIRNQCIDWPFSNEGNLDEHKYLDLCFNNFDGIPTTTPNGAWNGFRRLEIFVVMLLAGFVKVLIGF